MRFLNALFILLGACSLYKSDSRKFLEKNATQYAQSASANLSSCGLEPMDQGWLKTSEDHRVEIYSSTTRDYALRIVPKAENGAYSCGYQFQSVQEMIERTDSAIELTLEQMALGLVP